MPKRIVVCSDGTGNTAIKGRGTNVFKLFEAVDLDTHRFDANVTPQIAIYDDGVGTENFKPLKIFAGATGWGLSRNVRHLYKELARVYDPGDQIYMFGFSRGAFTIRTLVGLIGTCGLIDPERLKPRTFGNLRRTVKKAYRAYRKCYRPWLWRLFAQPSRDAGTIFKEKHSVPGDVMIRFVGVWDTVDAVGLPFHLSDVLNATVYQFKFPDHKLSPLVQRACHALADRRSTAVVSSLDLEGDTGRPCAHFAGLVCRRAFQRRRRLSEAGHVAGARSTGSSRRLSRPERLSTSTDCGSTRSNGSRFASTRAWTTSSTIHGPAWECSTAGRFGTSTRCARITTSSQECT